MDAAIVLKEFRNSTSGKFEYHDLDLSDTSREIRLLSLLPGGKDDDICCRISHADLNNLTDSSSYEALSYCWGDKLKQRLITIEAEGQSLSEMIITENLFLALAHLRRASDERRLWVDAICINQDDNLEKTEKNKQITMMRDIYQNAKNTLIWIGETFDNSEDALALIPRLNDVMDRDAAEGIERNLFELDTDRRDLPKPHEQIWYNLFEVLKRPWFYRAWIVQELAVSPHATVLCGNMALEWKSLVRAVRFLVEAGGLGLTLGMTGLQQLLALDLQRDSFQRGQFPTVMNVLLQNQKAGATLPRDHIFAFHGLFEPNSHSALMTKPDSRRECEEVYREFAIQLLQHYRNLDIFTLPRIRKETGTTICTGDCSKHCAKHCKNTYRADCKEHCKSDCREHFQHLATWVPDWSASDLIEPFLWRHICPGFTAEQRAIYRATGDSAYEIVLDETRKKIRLEGWIIDEVNMMGAVLEPSSDNAIIRDNEELARYTIQHQKVIASWEFISRGWDWFSTYPTGEKMADAYWQTLLGGCTYGDQDTMRMVFRGWHMSQLKWRALQALRLDCVLLLRLYIFLKGLVFAVLGGIFKMHSVTSRLQVNLSKGAFPRLAPHIGNRRVFKTDEGLIGLAPPLVEPGDAIVLCKGGKLPLILRQSPRLDGDWEIIGECYVHGLMDGNLWKNLEGRGDWNSGLWEVYRGRCTRRVFWVV